MNINYKINKVGTYISWCLNGNRMWKYQRDLLWLKKLTQNTGHTFQHLDWLWLSLFNWVLSTNTKCFASWIGWNIEILIVLSCSFIVLNTRDFLTAGRTRIQYLVVTGRLKCGSIFNVFSLYMITILDRTLIHRNTNPNVLCLVNSGSI